jgi:hypothetical protein
MIVTDVEKDSSAESEHKHHHYIGNHIPWYVHVIWVLFWSFAVYYVLIYLFPSLKVELLSPP